MNAAIAPPLTDEQVRGMDDMAGFDREDAIQQRNAERRYRRELARHPDPRDPDFPGDDE